MNQRELVLSMLKEIYAGNEFSHILIRQVLEKYDYLEGNEKAFIKRLTEGTLERTIELDYVINQFSNTPVNKMKPLIRSLMRMSVYQILYMDAIPDSAVCNEAVKLAAAHKFTSLKGFVNGVLRNIARNKTEIAYPKKEEDIKKYLSVTYSLPEWLVEHFIKEYDVLRAEKICEGLLQERPVTIRVSNMLLTYKSQKGESKKISEDTSTAALLATWKEQGIETHRHPYLPYAYVCHKTEGVKNMEGYEEGAFQVQDVSSMLVAHVAGIKSGMQILDVCAAPGGKATHAALELSGSGQVIARDLTQYKVDLILENAERLQLSNLWAEEWDALDYDETKEEWADVLFCDAPCSGLGIIGKKRDIKYRLTPDSLKEVAGLQRDILNTVWRYVKKDGILMYSTCTINREENEKQVQWIVENLPFEVVSISEELPEEVREDVGEYGLQLLPGIHETDGFFLCKLRRVK